MTSDPLKLPRKAEEFLDEYLELCERRGYCIASDGEEVAVWPSPANMESYRKDVEAGTLMQMRYWDPQRRKTS